VSALTAEEKKAHPEFQEIEPLVVELQKANDEFVAQGWNRSFIRKKPS